MSNYNLENQFNEGGGEANVPTGETRASGIPKEKLKEYGKQGLGPLLEIGQKYQGEIGPYLSALSKALNAGAGSLKDEGANEAEKSIGSFFSEAAAWFDGAKGRLEAKDKTEIMSFIEDEGRKHPGLLFSASYIAGIFLGRIGRHLGRETVSDLGDQEQSGFH